MAGELGTIGEIGVWSTVPSVRDVARAVRRTQISPKLRRGKCGRNDRPIQIMFSKFGSGSVQPCQIFQSWLVAVRFEPNFQSGTHSAPENVTRLARASLTPRSLAFEVLTINSNRPKDNGAHEPETVHPCTVG